MPAVKENSITGKKLPHQIAQWPVSGSDKKMKVVAKQRPRVASATDLGDSRFQASEKIYSIRIIKKNILAVQAPDNNMVNHSGYVYAFVSWHGCKYTDKA